MEFTYDECLGLVDEILDGFDTPGLGLRIRHQFRIGDFGILDYARQCARELMATPDNFRLSKIDFSFAAPEYAHMFEETFGRRVRFDQPDTRIYFPLTVFSEKLGATNNLAQEICEEQCRKLLRLLDDRGGLTGPGQISAETNDTSKTEVIMLACEHLTGSIDKNLSTP